MEDGGNGRYYQEIAFPAGLDGGVGDINDGIVTAPNVQPYTWDLKNFSRGTLNSQERVYYNSNGNIKNNIDRYLIAKNFSSMAMLNAKAALGLGKKLSMDYKVFNWGFQNSNMIFGKVTFYLNSNPSTTEAIGFAKAALTVVKNGGQADFFNEILKDPSFIGTRADCVLEALLKQTGYFKEVMNAFTNNNSKYRIKFKIGALSDQNHGGEAQTAAPDSNGIVTITITPGSSSGNTLDVASTLLHEGVHAQLHRIIATGNKTHYNITSEEYKWLLDLHEWWKDNSINPETVAQHDFMAVRYVNPIAKAVRKYDDYAQPIENYMYFGWEGLFDEAHNRGYINMQQFNSYTILAQLPLKNDNHMTSCD